MPDPAEQFHNPYLAMGNNPVMYVDPDGRHSQPIMYWDDDGNTLTGADGGLQDDSQMWTNLIYGGGASSNNHWGNGFRSKEYNEVFLTRKTYYELYGYDHINMFDVDRSDKEEVWNKALALSVAYEQKWRILQILRKPNGSIFGVYGDHVWEPVWSPLGTPQNFGANQSFRVDYPSRGSSDSLASRAQTELAVASLPLAVKERLIKLAGSGNVAPWYSKTMRIGNYGLAVVSNTLSINQMINQEIGIAEGAFDITIAWVGTAGIRGQIWFWTAQAGKSYGPSNWGSTFGPASSYGRFKYWIHN